MPQSLSNALLHLVFSTHDRRPVLTLPIREELYPYITGVMKNHGYPLLQIGGVEDHVHILFAQSRTVTIAQTVEKVKTSSSKWLKDHRKDFAWQAGYGAISVSPGDVVGVRAYIAGQEEHHRKRSYQEEFRELLRIAGIPFDERYVWD